MSSIINVSIYSQLSEFPTEKRYPSDIKIGELKEKLELVTGANHKTMKLDFSLDDKSIGKPSDDQITLGQFLNEHANSSNVFKLVVEDENPKDLFSGDVEKYTIEEEKYLSRAGNARDFIKEMREKRNSVEEAKTS